MQGRLWLLFLAVLGLLYSVLATRWYLTHWQVLAHIEGQSLLLDMLFRPFWFGVQLVPITIALALLRINIGYSLLIAVVYQLAMYITEFVGAPPGYWMFIVTTQFPLNLGMQVPIWGVTRLIAKLIPR